MQNVNLAGFRVGSFGKEQIFIELNVKKGRKRSKIIPIILSSKIPPLSLTQGVCHQEMGTLNTENHQGSHQQILMLDPQENQDTNIKMIIMKDPQVQDPRSHPIEGDPLRQKITTEEKNIDHQIIGKYEH